MKCIQYWPNQGSQAFGSVTVALKDTEKYSDFIIRTLAIKQVARFSGFLVFQFEISYLTNFHYRKPPTKSFLINNIVLI